MKLYTLQTTTTARPWWLTEAGTLSLDRRRAWAAEEWRLNPYRWRLRIPCQLQPNVKSAPN